METSSGKTETELLVTKGEPFNVSCRSVDSSPVEDCLFITPLGESPFGDNLSIGECVYQVSAASDRNFGIWRCFALVHRQQGSIEAYAEITIKDAEDIKGNLNY